MSTYSIKKVYGLEEYKSYSLPIELLYKNDFDKRYLLHIYYRTGTQYYLLGDKELKYFTGKNYDDTADIENIVHTDKEWINKAKKVYVYPSSKISRALLTKKFKKVLNPWMADMVVVPDNKEKIFSGNKALVFINDKSKTLYLFDMAFASSELTRKLIDRATLGIKLKDFSTADEESWYGEYKSSSFSSEDALESELEFIGNATTITNNTQWFFEVLAGNLPKDKLVFDSAIIPAISTEEDQVTAENLLLMYDLLNSPDEDNKAAGLKALATMNYLKYPTAIKYLLYETSHFWRYTKATSTTAVKFMLNQLEGIKNNWFNGIFNSKFIEQEDYNLFITLVKKVKGSNLEGNNIKDWLLNFPFMYQDGNLDIHPRIKKAG